MTIELSPRAHNLNIKFAGHDEICRLGLLLDQSLLQDLQVAAVASGAHFPQLWLLHQLCPFLAKKDTVMLTHAHVE